MKNHILTLFFTLAAFVSQAQNDSYAYKTAEDAKRDNRWYSGQIIMKGSPAKDSLRKQYTPYYIAGRKQIKAKEIQSDALFVFSGDNYFVNTGHFTQQKDFAKLYGAGRYSVFFISVPSKKHFKKLTVAQEDIKAVDQKEQESAVSNMAFGIIGTIISTLSNPYPVTAIIYDEHKKTTRALSPSYVLELNDGYPDAAELPDPNDYTNFDNRFVVEYINRLNTLERDDQTPQTPIAARVETPEIPSKTATTPPATALVDTPPAADNTAYTYKTIEDALNGNAEPINNLVLRTGSMTTKAVYTPHYLSESTDEIAHDLLESAAVIDTKDTRYFNLNTFSAGQGFTTIYAHGRYLVIFMPVPEKSAHRKELQVSHEDKYERFTRKKNSALTAFIPQGGEYQELYIAVLYDSAKQQFRALSPEYIGELTILYPDTDFHLSTDDYMHISQSLLLNYIDQINTIDQQRQGVM